MAEKEVKKPQLYNVRDRAAKGGKGREHEVIIQRFADGSDPLTKSYILHAEQDCPMPMDHALLFLKDPMFQVYNPKGELMAPVIVAQRGSKEWDLPDDQCIANLNELSKMSLFKRCKVLVGSEHLTVESSVPDLIEFLTSQRRKDRRGTLSDAEIEMANKAGGAEVMAGSDLATMMPTSDLVSSVVQ